MVFSPKTLAAFAVAGLLTRPVFAAEEPLELSWRAPAPCPTEAEFRAEVAALARAPSPGEIRPRLVVSVLVTAAANGTWQARVSTRGDGSGERVVSDTRCEDVARAVALVLAFALNPTEAPRAASPPLLAPAAPRALPLAIGADLVASPGTVPGLALAAQGRFALELAPASLELRVGGWLPTTEAVPSSARARVEVVAAEVAVASCHAESLTPYLDIQGCVGLAGDWLHVTSSGVTDPGSAAGVWASPFLEAVTRWAISEHVRLRFASQVGPALAAPRFAIAGDGVFFRPSPYLFRLGLGAELHF
jgi:hypothetical protein